MEISAWDLNILDQIFNVYILTAPQHLPLVFNSTWDVICRQFIRQNDSEQLKSNRVVFAVWVAATKPVKYDTGETAKNLVICVS